MITIYLHIDMISELCPLPMPSSTPDIVTDSADNINPMEMIRSAVTPLAIVSTFSVKRPMSLSGHSWQSTVPTAMMIMHIISVTSCVFFTRPNSFAP